MKPEDKQKLSSFLHPNKTSKDVQKAESDSKKFNPHLAVCHSENPPANNRTQPIILKTKDVTKSVSYTDEQVKMAFTSFLQDSEMVDVLFSQFVSDAESYNDIITILNNGGYLKA
ncbi:MAG: hypothetical protein ACRC7D_14980 [Aeromonas popoffii]|uniref:hypothetical protein n=1 Tax=Aeromonas popoffii TaxID=70856 RepID=UPI003F35F90B